MRLYIISPCRPEDFWRKQRATFTLPQMSLAILAALTPSHVEIKITDELVDDIDFNYPADLVAITTNTTNSPRAYEVAGTFREKGVKVIMGGIHPSVMQDEALLHADSVFIGEAEELWNTVIDDFRGNSLKQLYKPETYPDPANIPFGRWDLLKTGRYYTRRTFQSTRGCPHGCSFCSSTQFFGKKHRCRPVGNVIVELKEYKGRLAIFIDDNIAGNPAYARELFTEIKKIKRRWVAQSSIEIAKNNELLRLAAESGCAGILIGFESVIAENSCDVKKLRKVEQYSEAIKEIKSHGIGVHGSFIFGFDNDTPEVFENTVDFVMKNRLEVANYCKLTPFPGTRLFGDMSAQGRILHTDWEKYDRHNIVFKTKSITTEELHKNARDAYLKTYSIKSILRRMPSNIRNILPYFAINLSYRMGAKRLKTS